MTGTEHYQKLHDIIKIYLPEDVSAEHISEESHLINELNINSANLVDIVLDVEDAFDIRLENEDMDQMETVKDALRIIDSKLSDK
ncbi:acyl carrier protein [Maribacter algarum]|uniref:Acyl carrier protein n=1 Tax=Maribacter algarum (ex Zhang et al. 2020) TaxID=2578118 RepID=A0A5S3PR98_9FLAO|nr:phosphopantetheine-binding protein [Maribacter algarum]TMM57260.1 acyl carrier protein [Maribacter algarum]